MNLEVELGSTAVPIEVVPADHDLRQVIQSKVDMKNKDEENEVRGD